MRRHRPTETAPGIERTEGQRKPLCGAGRGMAKALAQWSVEGGPLPIRLSTHIEQCPTCRAQVARFNRVQASLTLLRTQALPPNLHARANGRALRLLRRAERASAAARDLLRCRPDLPCWQRIQFHVTRLSCGVAATLLLMMIRVTVVHAAEETRHMGETLAAMYADRHINPDGGEIPRDSHLA